MKKFEFIEHTADIKFRVFGKTINEIFENSALAISEILSKGNKIKKIKNKSFELSGKDFEELLYNFIEELIYLLDAEYFIVSNAKVEIKNKKLKAIIYGDNSRKYEGLDHIKAATYAEMYVKETKEKGKNKKSWEAQVVVDV